MVGGVGPAPFAQDSRFYTLGMVVSGNVPSMPPTVC